MRSELLNQINEKFDPTDSNAPSYCLMNSAGHEPGEPDPIARLESENARLTEALRAAEANADFLRKSVGAAHMMISRDDLKELDDEWDATDLPPRLKKYITGLCERLGKAPNDEEISRARTRLDGMSGGGIDVALEFFVKDRAALLAARRTQERGNDAE